VTYATDSDGRGCLFTTPDQAIADLVADVSAALMERPMNPKRVDALQHELTLAVRKTHKRRHAEARFAAKRAWNTGRVLTIEGRAA
jgi:hypothetical protein